jgi:hypothetical protein
VTEATWFALIAALALGGWAWTNIAHARASLPAANAYKVIQQIVEREDKMVESMVSRLERARNRGAEPAREHTPPPQREQRDSANPLAHLFSGFTETPIIEQPDSGMEVVE